MAKQGGQVEVLDALDQAKTQWYHFTTIIISGMGFFTDAYDLLCITTITKLLGRLYYYDPSTNKPGTLPPNVLVAVNGVALWGALAGQLFFGWLGDKLGRKKVYGMTLMTMVISAIASGLSFGHTAKSTMTTLCFFRFWLGFGIGGDYPLSATIMSEYANKKTRGAFVAAVFAMQGFGIGGDYPLSATIMSEYANKKTRGAFVAAVFAMQGFGILTGGAVSVIVAAAFNRAYHRPNFEQNPGLSTAPQADFVWRIILMFGAVPALLTYYWRLKMPETARYTALVAKNTEQAASDMAKVLQVDIEQEMQENKSTTVGAKDDEFGLFSREFARRHGLHLLGTTSTWFLLDIAFYSNNLSQKDIFTAVGWLPAAKNMNAIEEVFRVAKAQSLIALCATVPGYWFTVALIDRIGRFAIQLMGFFFMTVFMFALAIPYHHWRSGHPIGFVIMYSLTFFFSNFGPNSTTFVVPAEIFPARLRSTCHGISAAAGKAGAIVGAFGFVYAAESTHANEVDPGYSKGIGTKHALLLLAIICALGFFFTFLVPETKGRSLEEISGENEDSDQDEEQQARSNSFSRNRRTAAVSME